MSTASAYIEHLAESRSLDNKRAQELGVSRILGRLFPQQHAFVFDASRRKSALCPRRAGKTYACVAMLFRAAFEARRSNLVYLTLTRGQAQKNIWGTIKQFNDELKLGLKFHETFLQVRFPNGSLLQLQGADTRPEIDKLRGQAFDLVVIDECKSFGTTIMQELIHEVLGPALNDRLGQLVLIGTPGNVLAGQFFDATTEGGPGVKTYGKTHEGPFRWSFHKWSMQDNTGVPHLWSVALADKAANGWSDDDPRWIREYLGRWCPSDDVMVYAYNPERDSWRGELPEGHEWTYVLGADFGFEDDFALSVVAYADTCPTLYHVYDFKAPHLTIPDMAKAITSAQERFGSFSAMVGDTGNFGKALVATLNSEYGFHFEPAVKTDKKDYIELLNSDLISGRLKLHADSHAVNEMALLQWRDATKREEDKGTPNHACDALLYTWRYAYHHFSAPKQAVTELYSPAYWQERDDEAFERAARRRRDDVDFEVDFASTEDDGWL